MAGMTNGDATGGAADHLGRQVGVLRERLGDALGGADGEAVHQCRVATRRLDAGLRVCSPLIGKPALKLMKVTGLIRGALGPVRDGDVMLGHLRRLTDAQRARHAAAAGWLDGRLAKRRVKTAAGLKLPVKKTLGRLERWDDVWPRVAGADEAVRHLAADAAHRDLGELGAGGDADPHAVRLVVKRLRYTLDLAAAAGASVPPTATRAARRTQDTLGLWHDHAVLAQVTLDETAKRELPLSDVALADATAALARHWLRRSRAKLASFGRSWPKDAATLKAALNEALPLTSPGAPPSADGHVPPM